MCGIVGYVGRKAAKPILIEGLKRLEYRGYDSAGIAVVRDGQLHLCKSAGRITSLVERLDGDEQIARGCNVDKPRNLAKSVTVE